MVRKRAPLDPRTEAGMLAELIRNLRLIWRLLKDGRVPSWVKAIIPATIVYLLSPVDFLPDAFLGLGQLDDLAIILLGAKLFLDLCPPDIVKEHLADIVSVGARYRVVNEKPDSEADQPARYIEGKYRIVGDQASENQGRPSLPADKS